MNTVKKRIITGFCIGIATAAFGLLPAWCFSVFLASVCVYILAYEWPDFCRGWTPYLWLLAPVYILCPFYLMIVLNHGPHRALLAVIFLAAFSFDTGAYSAGSLWGRHLIAPSISPKKSWQGLGGGIILTIITLCICAWLYHFAISSTLIEMAIFLGILAFLGDLFESWLKRKAGLKDSGNALPGHGGVLDRVDSIIPLVYAIYLFIFLTTH